MVLDIDLLINFLAGLGGLSSAGILGYIKFQEEKKKLTQALNELTFQKEGLDFTDFLEEINILYKDLDELMQTTCIDRFAILRAWNGELSPRWTTAVFQVIEGSQKPITYVHFELDDDYVQRLREIYTKRSMVFNVEDIPEGAIKSVYESEGITSSMWCHLGTHKLQGSNSRAMSYCSFSTHDPKGIDASTATRCSVVASRLKGFSLNFT